MVDGLWLSLHKLNISVAWVEVQPEHVMSGGIMDVNTGRGLDGAVAHGGLIGAVGWWSLILGAHCSGVGLRMDVVV